MQKTEQKNAFDSLRLINVNEHTESKNGLTYLSWAWAWDTFKKQCPTATYEIVKSPSGLPYFESEAGAMVYTKVSVDNETHEMWLPVMDGANKAMKREPYTYTVKNWKTNEMVEKTVEAYTMFDVNKTIMRCLVKNLAMFGLGLYIYAGEDLPEEQSVTEEQAAKLQAVATELGADIKGFLKFAGADSFGKIKAASYDNLMKALDAKRHKEAA